MTPLSINPPLPILQSQVEQPSQNKRRLDSQIKDTSPSTNSFCKKQKVRTTAQKVDGWNKSGFSQKTRPSTAWVLSEERLLRDFYYKNPKLTVCQIARKMNQENINNRTVNAIRTKFRQLVKKGFIEPVPTHAEAPSDQGSASNSTTVPPVQPREFLCQVESEMRAVSAIPETDGAPGTFRRAENLNDSVNKSEMNTYQHIFLRHTHYLRDLKNRNDLWELQILTEFKEQLLAIMGLPPSFPL